MASWDDVRRIALALAETDEVVSRGGRRGRISRRLNREAPPKRGFPLAGR